MEIKKEQIYIFTASGDCALVDKDKVVPAIWRMTSTTVFDEENDRIIETTDDSILREGTYGGNNLVLELPVKKCMICGNDIIDSKSMKCDKCQQPYTMIGDSPIYCTKNFI